MKKTRAGHRALVVASVVMCIAMPLRAEQGTISLVLENDVFARTDRGYTNGLRWSWLSGPSAPGEPAKQLANALSLGPSDAVVRGSLELGQAMYTPDDLSRAQPDPTDRPYAGWLYLAGGIAAKSDSVLEQFVGSVGVVGRYSGASATQRKLHRVTGAEAPQGWDAQLPTEPTLQLFYGRSRRYELTRTALAEVDVIPHAGAALGNVFIYGDVGLSLRAGRNFAEGFGAPRVQPNLPGSDYFRTNGAFGWYVFGGVNGRAVARNLLLDGSTFEDSPRVKHRPFVGDSQLGFALTWSGVRLALAHVWRTKEFHGQSYSQRFGVISLSLQY